MKVGILGTGDVGKALGRGFVALGYETRMGSRAAGNDKAVAWAAEQGPLAGEGSFADVAAWADVLVLATLGSANEAALRAAGLENLSGKLLLDTTNPLDFSRGFPPSLAIHGEDSGGEQVQRLVPEAKVVKVFNSVGNALMFKPQIAGGPPTMFIAGDDADAKKQVEAILTEFGWETLDAGGIVASRYLEALCILWVSTAAKSGKWMQAFKMLR